MNNDGYNHLIINTDIPEELLHVDSSFKWNDLHQPVLSLENIDIDALWEKMYVNAKKMWFACPYCNSANALGSPTCCQCGAGLGDHE